MKPLNIRFQRNVTRSVSQTRHLSAAHDKIQHNHFKAVTEELEKAVDYCKENKCRDMLQCQREIFNLLKIQEPSKNAWILWTIALSGDRKTHLRVLTFEEEESFVNYLLNKNR